MPGAGPGARGHDVPHLLQDGLPGGLAACAKSMETRGKTEGMDGKLATEMWAQGDREPVVLYCEAGHGGNPGGGPGLRARGKGVLDQPGRTDQQPPAARGWLTVAQP